ncbi:MAG: Rne/Rng family ribonuclease [Rhodospirillales bacterium]|nr:Rne/Rng family ribonuclease [Rhodospirillales bacterium]
MATKRMLIDASHPEETRVVVVDGTRVEDFDVEVASRRQLKGNIYLAKVTRVEPSLQAAFVDYGGNRHGFLAFNEIHPDYYQIPVADRERLLAEQAAAIRAESDEREEAEDAESSDAVGGGDDEDDGDRRRSRQLSRYYKIQEVIKRRQIMLVQVAKEERGNKGAALTTYLSLAGRYCVLMPNTARGGGISRKIIGALDRKRLKKILTELEVPEGMAVIVRTAGSGRSKAEIKRDYEYLMRLWSSIREKTLESSAPTLVYEEASLIKRSIRDLYGRDIEEIIVQGEDEYRIAKEFMKLFITSHAKRVKLYEDAERPLFQQFEVEEHLDSMHEPTVQLRSGGYIVINPTEALVAIDVNSGRSTRERNIEETALRTNLEAADEIARQLRLRDLAGLIVVDFIDMENARNQGMVERRLKEAMKNDRARVQIGRISPFGLLELSRQRLRPSLIETCFEVCPACGGNGLRRTTESTALAILRKLEEEGIKHRTRELSVAVAPAVVMYLLNQKRRSLVSIEDRYKLSVSLIGDETLVPPDHRAERLKLIAEPGADEVVVEADHEVEVEVEADVDDEVESTSAGERDDAARRGRRRRPRRRRRSDDAVLPMEAAADAAEELAESDEMTADADADVGEEAPHPEDAVAEDAGEQAARKRRRRGKRGGRRRVRNPVEGSIGDEMPASDGLDADNLDRDHDGDDHANDAVFEGDDRVLADAAFEGGAGDWRDDEDEAEAFDGAPAGEGGETPGHASAGGSMDVAEAASDDRADVTSEDAHDAASDGAAETEEADAGEARSRPRRRNRVARPQPPLTAENADADADDEDESDAANSASTFIDDDDGFVERMHEIDEIGGAHPSLADDEDSDDNETGRSDIAEGAGEEGAGLPASEPQADTSADTPIAAGSFDGSLAEQDASIAHGGEGPAEDAQEDTQEETGVMLGETDDGFAGEDADRDEERTRYYTVESDYAVEPAALVDASNEDGTTSWPNEAEPVAATALHDDASEFYAQGAGRETTDDTYGRSPDLGRAETREDADPGMTVEQIERDSGDERALEPASADRVAADVNAAAEMARRTEVINVGDDDGQSEEERRRGWWRRLLT